MRLNEIVALIGILTFCGIMMFVGIRVVDSYLTLCKDVHTIVEHVERIENSGPPASSSDILDN